jgi:FMN-dependent NADH-azoreductase
MSKLLRPNTSIQTSNSMSRRQSAALVLGFKANKHGLEVT